MLDLGQYTQILTMDSKFEKLHKFYLSYIPDMTEAEFQIVCDNHELKTYKKDEVLLSPGINCDWVAFVNSGILRVYHSVDGKEFINQIYFPDSVVSDITSFDGNIPSRMYIDVVKDCEILEIKREKLNHLTIDFPKILRLIVGYTTSVLISYLDRYSSLTLDSAETRYLKLLKEKPEMLQQIPLYMIASYLGITLEALSRVRNKIAQTGA